MGLSAEGISELQYRVLPFSQVELGRNLGGDEHGGAPTSASQRDGSHNRVWPLSTANVLRPPRWVVSMASMAAKNQRTQTPHSR